MVADKLYLLDANTLIDAKRDYYPLKRVPEFWDWLIYNGQQNKIKIPIEIYEEFLDTNNRDRKKDELAVWAAKKQVKDALLLNEESVPEQIAHVTDKGYAPDPTDDEIIKIGRDPFLIAYALTDPKNRCIVTTEISSPKKERANRKIPDVCKDFDIHCINTFMMIRELDFSTRWQLR